MKINMKIPPHLPSCCDASPRGRDSLAAIEPAFLQPLTEFPFLFPPHLYGCRSKDQEESFSFRVRPKLEKDFLLYRRRNYFDFVDGFFSKLYPGK